MIIKKAFDNIYYSNILNFFFKKKFQFITFGFKAFFLKNTIKYLFHRLLVPPQKKKIK
jgi:hypothetical protein